MEQKRIYIIQFQTKYSLSPKQIRIYKICLSCEFLNSDKFLSIYKMLYAKVLFFFFFNKMGKKPQENARLICRLTSTRRIFFCVDYFLISAINRHCEYTRIITNTQSGHVFHWHEFYIFNTPKVN